MADSDSRDRSDDRLRVGNPERERAVRVLSEAFANAYLDVSEFEERSGCAYRARTRRELLEVVEDLPGAATALFGAPISAVGGTPGALRDAVVPADHRVEYNVHMKKVKRAGVWTPDLAMLFTGSTATIDLDFAQAQLLGPVVDIELKVSTAKVKIGIGSDQQVRTDGLWSPGRFSVIDKSDVPMGPIRTTINIHGSMTSMSLLVVRNSR